MFSAASSLIIRMTCMVILMCVSNSSAEWPDSCNDCPDSSDDLPDSCNVVFRFRLMMLRIILMCF